MIKVEGSSVKGIGANLRLFRLEKQNRNQPLMLAL
jgi:ribosomal protein L39E